MSGAWIAGGVRARLLVAERCLGPAGCDEIAAAPSLRDALAKLGHTPYRRGIELTLGLGGAQRAVAAKALLDLRVLAGWLPGDALGLLRTLCAWFELANLEDRAAAIGGTPAHPPFELGALASAWPRGAEAQSLAELRRALASSSWGDPGGESPAEVCLGLRLAWARRAAAGAPEVRAWAAGATALLLARELFVAGVPAEQLPPAAAGLLGEARRAGGAFDDFADGLPREAAWALRGSAGPDELWRAEGRWWARVERDARHLLHGGVATRGVVVGAAALLAVDARRVATALEAVARKGLRGVSEALDVAA